MDRRYMVSALIIAATLLSPGLIAAQPPSSTDGYKILLLRMRASGESHEVLEARIVDSRIPLSPVSASQASLSIVATDANGTTLLAEGLPDPSIVRAPLPHPGEPPGGHQYIARPTQYFVRLPYEAAMKYVYIRKGQPPSNIDSSAKKNAAATQSTMLVKVDLDSWLGPQR